MSTVRDTDRKTGPATAPGLRPGLEQTMAPVSVTVPEPGLALDLVLATVKELYDGNRNIYLDGYGVGSSESRGTYIGSDFERGIASGSGRYNCSRYGCPQTDIRNEINLRSGKGFALGSGEDNGNGHG